MTQYSSALPTMGYGKMPMGYGNLPTGWAKPMPNTNSKPFWTTKLDQPWADVMSSANRARGNVISSGNIARGGVISSAQQAWPGVISAYNQIPIANIEQGGETNRTILDNLGLYERDDLTSGRGLNASLADSLARMRGQIGAATQGRIGQVGAAEQGRIGQIGAAEQGRIGQIGAATQGRMASDLSSRLGLRATEVSSGNQLIAALTKAGLGLRGVQEQAGASRDVASTQAQSAIRQSELGNVQYQLRQERFAQILPLLVKILSSIGGISGRLA